MSLQRPNPCALYSQFTPKQRFIPARVLFIDQGGYGMVMVFPVFSV